MRALQDHHGNKPALLSQDMLRRYPDEGELLRQRILDAAKPHLLQAPIGLIISAMPCP